MAITAARCCVNLLPPSPSAPDSNSSQKSSSSSMPAAASIGGGLGDDQRRRWSSSNSNSNSNSWRSRCVLAMTCTTIIGSLEMGNLAGALMVMGNQGYYAAATAAANEDTAATYSLVIQSSGSGTSGIGKQEITGSGRWSEKRSCPAWNSNSNYETIVPENLPRPSARRRWEAVAHHGSSHVAPSVKAAAAAINVNIAPTTTRTNSNCFSM